MAAVARRGVSTSDCWKFQQEQLFSVYHVLEAVALADGVKTMRLLQACENDMPPL